MFALTIEDDNGQVAEKFSFDHGSYVVGRSEQCDIVLPSSSVSRTHAKLFVEEGGCYVEDLDSANGVKVDGQRVVGKRQIGSAAQIQLGDYYLYVEHQGPGGPSARGGRQTLFISEDEDHKKLVRVNDEFAGEEFVLSEVENTIGRTDENFILLSDPSISREHSVISRDGDRYVLTDRGSSNGTRVNSEGVIGPHDLESGDVVEFGNVEFVFTHGDADIDPTDYADSGIEPSRTLIAGIIAVTAVLSAVGVGLLVLYTLSSGTVSGGSADTAAVAAEESSPLLQKGETFLENEQWGRAEKAAMKAIENGHDRAAAERLRRRARQGRRDRERLQRGLGYSKRGEYEKALDQLDDIPEDSPVYDKAEPTLEHVRKTIAYDLHREATPADDHSGAAEFKKARSELLRAKRLAPTDSNLESTIEESLRDLESLMEKNGFEIDE